MSFTPPKQFDILPAVGNTENVPDILKKTLEAFDEQLPPHTLKVSPLKQ